MFKHIPRFLGSWALHLSLKHIHINHTAKVQLLQSFFGESDLSPQQGFLGWIYCNLWSMVYGHVYDTPKKMSIKDIQRISCWCSTTMLMLMESKLDFWTPRSWSHPWMPGKMRTDKKKSQPLDRGSTDRYLEELMSFADLHLPTLHFPNTIHQ